ncbi:MAG: type IV toxin-antitoxin system AbiEi family antitoxin domain-containing protein [Marmoricola sp.]
MDELANLRPHGIFLRSDVLAAGYDDRALYQALARGSLTRVRHGAYVASPLWGSASDPEKHLLRAHAAALTHKPEFALSHVTGSLLHGVTSWGVALDRIHVSREACTVGRKHRDITYHRESVEDVGLIHGSPVLPAATCLLGAARLCGVEAGTVLLDSAYEQGICTPEDIRAEFDKHRGWPGTARLQLTLRLAQPGSQSVGESRMRYLFWRAHLPRPVLQYVVRHRGAIVGISDFAWPEYRLLGEFDGRVKYKELLHPGEDPSDAVFREKVREDRMREVTGWSFIRFTWADL